MCLILVAFKVEPNFPLVVAANRDEYFARPTSKAHFWPDHGHVFAGRDLQDGGTWMGVSTTGRFAAVANWSFSNEQFPSYRSRGALVREFLLADDTSAEFVRTIKSSQYRGCNFVAYDGIDLVHWSNHGNFVATLDSGCHVISNADFRNNSPRVCFGRNEFEQLPKKSDVNALLALLGPRESPRESDCYVVGDTYGTRASSALLIGTRTIVFSEQQYGPNGVKGTLTVQEIALTA